MSKIGKNKTEQLIYYLISKHFSPTVTSLIKLCYLCDLVSVKNTGEQITDFKYIRWHFGPYDQQINEILLNLISNKSIVYDLAYSIDGDEYMKYKISDSEEFELDELNEKDRECIDLVLNSLAGYGAKSLTQVAYKTKPMLKLKATLGGQENMGVELDLNAE